VRVKNDDQVSLFGVTDRFSSHLTRPRCFTLLTIDYTILGTFFFGDGIFLEKTPFPVTIVTQRLLF
jgi:hypothetical protein